MTKVTTDANAFELKDIISDTVNETLIKLGVDIKNPVELQKDFAHLRAWRESSEELKQKGLLALVGIIVTGFAGLVWTAFKGSLH